MDSSGIRGVAIRNESNLLIVSSCTDSFPHRDNRRQGSPVVSNVVGRDFQVLAGNEEEDVMVFAQHLDIGLITGADGVNRSFMPEVETVTVPGGPGSIIEHRLMRNLHTEDISENSRSLSGRDGKRDIEGQDQAEDILTVMDFGQFDRRFVRR